LITLYFIYDSNVTGLFVLRFFSELFKLRSIYFFIENQGVFDLLRYKLIFSVTRLIRGREYWVQYDSEEALYNQFFSYLKVFSKTSGIMRASKGQDISKHGLVFTSIRYSRKFSSNIKS
jgi:hypothetical protein